MDISVQFLILVPVVLGITQVVKVAGMKSRFAPLVSLVLGVAGAMLLVGGIDKASALQGIIAGLSACGLWSGVKKSVWG